MSDPWLSIPLADYEGHMGADNVQQLSALSGLFKHALDVCLPDSVAILGIAGGNGLEHANPATIKRIVGFDINPGYIDEVRRRFVTHPNRLWIPSPAGSPSERRCGRDCSRKAATQLLHTSVSPASTVVASCGSISQRTPKVS
jgi:hypothetical protein